MNLTQENDSTVVSSGVVLANDLKADLTTLSGTIALLEVFKGIRHDMPLQHAHTFMLVACQEGLSVLDYAERAGVAQSVMTRNLLDIGERNRRGGPGYGLVVTRMDPNDRRRHQTFLTHQGRALLHKVLRAARAIR